MARLLLVCLGGALGSGARFVLSTWALHRWGPSFPRGTLLVNASGSFAIALVMELSLRSAAIGPDLRVFLTAGVLGGYTTYSSFNYESMRLAQVGAYGAAALNLALTVAGCLVAGALGVGAARLVARVL